MVKRGTYSTSSARALAPRGHFWPALFSQTPLGAAVLGAALSLAGCGSSPGSFDVEQSNQSKWDNLMAMVEFKKPPAPTDPADPIKCPDIVILDGTADDRVFATADQSNANLRYQFSITDIARDCKVNGDRLTLRVGVTGKLLLGPMGSPGSFTGPVRVAVVNNNDQTALSSKLYQVGVSLAAGQSDGTFSLVTEPFDVPYPHRKAQYDYTIKVGFDTAGAGAKKPRRGRLPEAEEAMPTAPASTSEDATPRRHRHHGAPAASAD